MAFHRQGIIIPQDVLLGLVMLLGMTGCQIYVQPQDWLGLSLRSIAGCGVAVLTGYYFDRKLGGHTGDTYGAVVEWTEASILCLYTIHPTLFG